MCYFPQIAFNNFILVIINDGMRLTNIDISIIDSARIMKSAGLTTRVASTIGSENGLAIK